MTHLYRHLLHVDPIEVELLLGPFVVWHTASIASRRITQSMLYTAAELYNVTIGQSGRSVDAEAVKGTRFSAILRISKLWHMYLVHSDSIGEDFTFGMYTGILIDLHLPLAMSWADNKIHEVYRKNLAPEQIPIDRVHSSERHLITPAGIEAIWPDHINENAGKHSKRAPAKSSKRRAAKSQPAGSNVATLLPPPRDGPKPEKLFYNPAHTPTHCYPTWKKGTPSVSSIRYISTTLK